MAAASSRPVSSGTTRAAFTDLSNLAALGLGGPPLVAGAVTHPAKEALGAKRQARNKDLYYLLELDRRL